MTINNIARNQMSEPMMRLASGQRVNSAADDAAGLAIIENMTSQIRGLDQGERNTRDMQSLVQTAEGGLDGIGESLNRIRELSIQALNGTNTPANREMIQAEISQLADGIQAAVQGTQFNTMNLLDGSAAGGLNTASSPDGTGATVYIRDMSDMANAISNFNVTGEFNQGQIGPVTETVGGESTVVGEFDLNVIDSAIAEVNAARANLGAMYNRFDYTASANTVSSLNLADSRSRISDTDVAAEMMRNEQEQMLTQVQILMQQQEQRNAEQQGIQAIAGATM